MRHQQVNIRNEPCSVCARVTPHKVTSLIGGDGTAVSTVPECTQHRTWSDGRVQIHTANGWQWLEFAARWQWLEFAARE